MSSGFPDYFGWAGRVSGGENILVTTSVVSIPTLSSSFQRITNLSQTQQIMIQQIIIKTDDDSSINDVSIYFSKFGVILYNDNFISKGVFNVPGISLNYNEYIEVTITNNSSSSLNFFMTTTYIERSI